MIGQDIKYTINLAHGIPVITLNTPLAQGDDRAQKFIFELMNGDDKADTSALACTAYFVRGEGQEDSDTISLGGEFSDNILTVELKSGCYTKQTYFVLSVRLIDQNTGIKRTIVFVRGVVRTTQDGGSGDPDESLPSVEEILALMDDVEKAIERANEAAERAENAAGSGGSGGGLPTGGGAYQQLVTDGDGNALWEDRTHYTYQGEVVAFEGTALVPDENALIAVTSPLPVTPAAGKTYNVTWNGVEYECLAGEMERDGVTAIFIGDVGAMTGAGDTGEPFLFLAIPPAVAAVAGMYAGIFVLDGSTSVTVKVSFAGEAVKRIDYKYMPEYLYGIEDVPTAPVLNQTTFTFDGNEVSEVKITEAFASDLVVGAVYDVYWNGAKYVVTAAEIGGLGVGVGNLYKVGASSTDTGEPFVIIQLSETAAADQGAPGMVVAYDYSVSATVSITTCGQIIHKVPEQFLPKVEALNLVNGSADGSLRSVNAADNGDQMGENAVAIGYEARAIGPGSFALGDYAEAGHIDAANSPQGDGIAIGSRTTAFDNSVAIGRGSVAKYGGFAIHGNTAFGSSAFAAGSNTEAQAGQFVFGTWNVVDKSGKYVHIVGNGNSSGNAGSPEYSNAHTLDWDGNAWYQGSVLVGGTSQEDADYLVTRTELASAVGSGNVIPSYWLTHLNERIPAIRAAMTAAGWKKSAFLWYHDVHWTYGYKKAPMLLKYLYEHTPINKTMFGGDVVDNEGDTSTMAYLWDWRDAVRDIPNHHSVPGNHDDGNTTDNLWDDPYIYAYLLAAEETPDVVRTDAGLYYYIDDPTEKTRYLYIDTATKDGNIINDTAEQAWLVESLKSTPAGWHIVAIAHIWRTVDYDASPPADAGWSYGGAYCIGEFDKYNARTGEYASCTGKVEFCIGGHTHVDADFVSDGGIPVILTECDSRYVRSGLECTEGTITESSVNAIVADYANGIVNVIRIGRGSSRTVNLDGSGSSGGETPDVPDVPTGDFTNTLTEAGFSEGMRFSNTSLTDVEAAGWDITGYIPATRGDVIRFANVNFLDLDGTGGTSRAMIYLFDANKTYITCSANYDPNNLMSDAWSAVYGDDGDVVQFTIPTSYSANTAYIRIGARNIDQYSVITVNEPIE